MSSETNYLKDLLKGLQCSIEGLAVAHAPVYRLALEGQPVRYVARHGTEMPTIAPVDNVPLYAFAWQTGPLVDVEAGGVIVHRTTTARVALVYPLDNAQTTAQFSVFSEWERNATDYAVKADKVAAQLDGFAGFVELFGQVPHAQYAVYADFDIILWLTDCPDGCSPADWQPQEGCNGGPISPQPSGGLTCDTLGQCPVIQNLTTVTTFLQEDVGEIEVEIDELQTAVGDLSIDITSLQTQVGNIETDLGAVEGDVLVLQGDVSTLQSNVSTLQTDVALAQADATQALLDAAAADAAAFAAQTTADNALANALAALLQDRNVPITGIGVRYALTQATGATTNATLLLQNEYNFLEFTHLTTQPTALEFRVSSNVVGATAKVAIWDDANTFSSVPAPGNVLWESPAPFAVATAGLYSVDLTTPALPTLVIGQKYFIGIIYSSASVQFVTSAGTTIKPMRNSLYAYVSWRSNVGALTPASAAPANPAITETASNSRLLAFFAL